MWAPAVIACAALGCGRVGFSIGSGTDARVTVDGSLLPAWQLVQVMDNTANAGPASLATTIASTDVGDLLVAGIHFDPGGTITGVAADPGASSFVAVSGSLANNTPGGDAVEIWVLPSASAGVTSITATASTKVYTVVVWEFATHAPASVDMAAELSQQAASTMPVSPTVTTQRAGELVVGITIVQGGVTGIAAGNDFTNDTNANGNGWAHLASETAPAGTQQAVWTSDSGTYCSDAVAFHVGE